MPFHELEKVQLQERVMLMTQDSIGRLKTLFMSILAVALRVIGNVTAHRSALKNS